MSSEHEVENVEQRSRTYPEGDLIRNWGIVIYPTEIGEAPEWEIAKGRHEVDPVTGRHIISSIASYPGLEDGTVAVTELDRDGRQQWRLSQGPNNWACAPEELANTIYLTVAYLSEDRDRPNDEYELLKALLLEWVWKAKWRGEDPKAEMKKLIDAALAQLDEWTEQGDQEERIRRVRRIAKSWVAPMSRGEFAALKRTLIQAYRPTDERAWIYDIENDLENSELVKEVTDARRTEDTDCMYVARGVARPGVTHDQMRAEFEDIWALGFGSIYEPAGVAKGYTVSSEDELVRMEWILGSPKGWFLTGRTEVDIPAT